MVATVKIHSYHGSTPVTNDITGIQVRFKRADNDTVDASNPLIITAGITTFSYRKHTRLAFLTAPSNQIENVKWLIDETSGGGQTYMQNGFVHFSRVNSTYTEAPTTDVGAPVSGTVNTEENYTSTSPLTVFAGVIVTSGSSFPTYGDSAQDYVVQQMGVRSDASPGASPVKTLVYRFDES